jgi:hypothetical protein
MRTFAKWIAVLTFSAVALLMLILRATSNVVELEYANYEQAAAAGAFARQELPDHLPKSAMDIHSARDLDNNGEVATFRYGPDFDLFIAAQATAAPRTAKSLGIRLWSDHFTDLNKISYLPKVAFYNEHKVGSLLINRVDKVALYID